MTKMTSRFSDYHAPSISPFFPFSFPPYHHQFSTFQHHAYLKKNPRREHPREKVAVVFKLHELGYSASKIGVDVLVDYVMLLPATGTAR